MTWWPLFCFLTWSLASSAVAIEERKLHRLVGGHLRIINEDPNDTELLTALASGSKSKKSNKSSDDEEKKTLSQQVADGKYGLIQKELFAKPSKRPGVLSYETNPEVPKDNINNLGGLTKNDIWLAENHLLVLKGGTYPAHNNDNSAPSWPAIDDYKAPTRQVKIPAHPKVPPPFPVQLTDDGPLQILGTNYTRTLNGTLDENTYAIPPPEGYQPGTGPYFPSYNSQYSPNSTPGQAPHSISSYPQGEYPKEAPFPPFPLNGTLPPYFASLPPGAAILPPPVNQTEPFDEDDPSIYYPPPYSFYYPRDNSSLVPPGPLVPGIILPPPPNFFGLLDDKKKTTPARTTTPKPQIHPTTTPIPATSMLSDKTTTTKPIIIPSEINDELFKHTVTTRPPKLITILPARRQKTRRPPQVTVLKPVQPPKVYVYENEVPDKYRQRAKTVISTTQVPLKVYYSSTNNDIETNSITHPPEKYHIGIAPPPKITTKPPPAQYYFYEETTKRPFFNIPKEYYVPAKPNNHQQQQQQQQQKYIYVTRRPQYNHYNPPKTDSFSIHIARLQKQIHQYYTTQRPTYRHSPKPVYQFSFEAANYHPQIPPSQDQQDKFRPLPKYSVQIQPAIEIIPSTTERPAASNYYNTPRPDYEYEDEQKVSQTPRPISQFAFEATPNPIYQGFYTKPDEGYFDENTKEYFTTFGKKLPTATTTPIPRIVQTRQRQSPPTFVGDTNVNYLNPRPTINPNAERVNYPQVVKYSPTRPAQFAQETRLKNQEIAKAPGSFISYQLPGDDGAHFYFLTPQLAQSRHQGAGYYYSQPNLARIRRNKER